MTRMGCSSNLHHGGPKLRCPLWHTCLVRFTHWVCKHHRDDMAGCAARPLFDADQAHESDLLTIFKASCI